MGLAIVENLPKTIQHPFIVSGERFWSFKKGEAQWG